MKSLKCIFGFHKWRFWTTWIIDPIYKYNFKECTRCGKTDRDIEVELKLYAANRGWKYEYKNQNS
jgi:hypothetical protein